jgi:hypothetical protein
MISKTLLSIGSNGPNGIRFWKELCFGIRMRDRFADIWDDDVDEEILIEKAIEEISGCLDRIGVSKAFKETGIWISCVVEEDHSA